MTHRKLVLALALLPAPAFAQRVQLVVDHGTEIPGVGEVLSATAQAVNDNGNWAAEIGIFGSGALVVDGNIRHRSGDPLPNGGNYTSFRDVHIDSQGRVALSTPIGFSPTGTAVLLDGAEVARVGTDTGEAGFTWFNPRAVGFADTGRIVLRGQITEAATGAQTDALGFVDVDAAGGVVARGLIAREGQPLPAGLGNLVGAPRGIRISPDGRLIWVVRFDDPNPSADEAVLLDQTVLALEGQPSPIPGEPWRVTGGVYSVSPVSTSWVASGRIAGGNLNPILAAAVDGVLERGPGDVPAGVAPFPIAAIDEAFLDGNEDLLWRGTIDHPDQRFSYVALLEDQPIFRAGVDPIFGQYGFILNAETSPNARYTLASMSIDGDLAVALIDTQGTPYVCGLAPDAYEPNDVCSMATPVSVGPLQSAEASVTDEDWYTISIDPDESLDVRALHTAVGSEVDLEVFAGDCGNLQPLAVADQPARNEGLIVQNRFNVTRDFFIRVTVPSRSAADCAGYRLVVEKRPPGPCIPGAGFTDDMFEPNNGCANATPIGTGVYADLHVSQVAADHYEVLVPPGGLAQFATRVEGPGRLELTILQAGCTDVELSRIYGDDLESVYSNTTEEVQRVVCRVAVAPGPQFRLCAEYELTVFGFGDRITTGGPICTGNANSTGVAAGLLAYGDDRAILNLFELRTTGLPPGAAGFYLASFAYQVTTNPGGAQGDLCLGSPIGRVLDSVQFATPYGEAAWRLDLTEVPQPVGFAQVLPGSIWYFQQWYRDANPGPVSNFSDGVFVPFR